MHLQYTSMLFATITVHAFLLKRYALGLFWLVQNQVSIVHHANHANPSAYMGGNIIRIIDRGVANINWIYTLSEACKLSPRVVTSWIVWVSLPYTFAIYYLFLYHASVSEYKMLSGNTVATRAHQSLHIVSVVGIHAMIIATEQSKRI